ncbi:MAG TPA: methyltransferase domain-containing protein [Candidatus Ozemobacteraceae bacterium]|nr:methyltransferase domain-containing protein [Candidatus Ozemobacteraceae bacterium]
MHPLKKVAITLAGICKKGLNRFRSSVFVIRGKRPWSYGYQAYKDDSIKRVLSDLCFHPDHLCQGHGHRLDERIVEYPWFLSRLPQGRGVLLDAGSVLNHEFLVSHPKLSEKKLFISTLAPESRAFWQRGISYVYEDLRRCCFRDEYFDWITSLSTIEHIGLDNAKLYSKDAYFAENRTSSHLDAVKEFRRILKPGGTLYLSFPYGTHRNHGWFQVFDASMVQNVIDAFGPSRVQQQFYRYTPEGWINSNQAECANATFFDVWEHGLNYDPDMAAASRCVACLELSV